MAIITQTDKRSGITYAYETEYYWDKEKKQSRSKRICVGKVDATTGEIVPTRGRAKKGEAKAAISSAGKTGPKPLTRSSGARTRMMISYRRSTCSLSSERNPDCPFITASLPETFQILRL